MNMKTVQEYEIIIRLTKENGRYGAAAETVSGGLLESVPPLSAAGNDALYALLHALALKNNFSGCLKEAQRRESVKNIEAKIEEKMKPIELQYYFSDMNVGEFNAYLTVKNLAKPTFISHIDIDEDDKMFIANLAKGIASEYKSLFYLDV
ncbi:hypothetical protein AB3W99_002239, partial [Neisseria gonorrhoeae]